MSQSQSQDLEYRIGDVRHRIAQLTAEHEAIAPDAIANEERRKEADDILAAKADLSFELQHLEAARRGVKQKDADAAREVAMQKHEKMKARAVEAVREYNAVAQATAEAFYDFLALYTTNEAAHDVATRAVMGFASSAGVTTNEAADMYGYRLAPFPQRIVDTIRELRRFQGDLPSRSDFKGQIPSRAGRLIGFVKAIEFAEKHEPSSPRYGEGW